MRVATTAALLTLLAAPAALAQGGGTPRAASPNVVSHVETVADLAAVCDPAWSGVPRLEAIAYCQGFLTSAGQYHALLYPRGGPARPLFCVPSPGPSIAESGLAFAAWARQNPTHAREPALDGLLRWAQASYPCPPAAPPARAPRPAR
jgi:Rap1a immunity proteins